MKAPNATDIEGRMLTEQLPVATAKSHRNLLLGCALIGLVLIAYAPVLYNGYIWDDREWITENQTLFSPSAMSKIWFRFDSGPQYYPIVHTMFWCEARLWHMQAAGFHVVNVISHAANALLLVLLLSRLAVPGAWLAGFLFALHPVHVESVAWIAERKNVLSLFFYLLAALSYFQFAWFRDGEDVGERPSRKRRWVWYALALAAFVCSLLSKTATVTFPAAALLVIWWKRGRLASRDVLPLVPFFAVAFGLGLVTAWVETHHAVAKGENWAFGPVERILIAGRALWFYAGKLAWPHPLIFHYPRWNIDPHQWWQYIYPVAALVVIGALWIKRDRIGRGPLVAVLFFAGTLIPALGFFNVFAMVFSFVADHFQYHASIGLIVLFAAGCARMAASSKVRAKPGNAMLPYLACGVLLAVMGVLTFKQTQIYRSDETLFRDIVAKNPQAWMAQSNLAGILFDRHEDEEALQHLRLAAKASPGDSLPRQSLVRLLLYMGRKQEAAEAMRDTVMRLGAGDKPIIEQADNLLKSGNPDRALELYAKVAEDTLQARQSRP